MKAHTRTVCFKTAVFSSSVRVCHNVDASEEVNVVEEPQLGNYLQLQGGGFAFPCCVII